MAEDIVKLLFRPNSLIILGFLTLSADTKFQGDPLQQGCKIHGGGKILRFRLKLPFILETV